MATENKRIEIGTTIKWRGTWGTEPEIEAKVEGIQICAEGCKEGRGVKSIAYTTKDRCVFDLDNQHCAYGHQITL